MSWRFWRRKHTIKFDPIPGRVWVMPNGLVLQNVHPREKCFGRACVIHNPSGHAQSNFPLIWRNDRSMFERICPCGIGHPDRDQADFWIETGQEYQFVHGCCGIKGHC